MALGASSASSWPSMPSIVPNAAFLFILRFFWLTAPPVATGTMGPLDRFGILVCVVGRVARTDVEVIESGSRAS